MFTFYRDLDKKARVEVDLPEYAFWLIGTWLAFSFIGLLGLVF